MRVLTRAEYERYVFIRESLLGRLTDDEIRRWRRGNPKLAAAATRMRVALLGDDDDMTVEAGDILRASLPDGMLFNRQKLQRVPR